MNVPDAPCLQLTTDKRYPLQPYHVTRAGTSRVVSYIFHLSMVSVWRFQRIIGSPSHLDHAMPRGDAGTGSSIRIPCWDKTHTTTTLRAIPRKHHEERDLPLTIYRTASKRRTTSRVPLQVTTSANATFSPASRISSLIFAVSSGRHASSLPVISVVVSDYTLHLPFSFTSYSGIVFRRYGAVSGQLSPMGNNGNNVWDIL